MCRTRVPPRARPAQRARASRRFALAPTAARGAVARPAPARPRRPGGGKCRRHLAAGARPRTELHVGAPLARAPTHTQSLARAHARAHTRTRSRSRCPTRAHTRSHTRVHTRTRARAPGASAQAQRRPEPAAHRGSTRTLGAGAKAARAGCSQGQHPHAPRATPAGRSRGARAPGSLPVPSLPRPHRAPGAVAATPSPRARRRARFLGHSSPNGRRWFR